MSECPGPDIGYIHAFKRPAPRRCVLPPLLLHTALLLASAVVIYLSCEYFVNGIEWVGQKMGVGEKATGTILAAFGTALPESIVTLVAVAFGANAASKELGVGAVLSSAEN